MRNLKFIILLSLCNLSFLFSQVGIGTTEPKSELDIVASDSVSPNNTDGILIPRIDNFPSIDPTADQDSLLVFLTGVGTPLRGFYYWENSTTSWVLIGSNVNSNFSLVRVTLSANQILNNSGWQNINFDTESFDINNEFNTTNNIFTATIDGYYRVIASYHTSTFQTNTNDYGLGIFINGSSIPYKEQSYNHFYSGTGSGSQVVRNIDTVVYLNMGDFFETKVRNFQSGGVELDLFEGKTNLVIERIR